MIAEPGLILFIFIPFYLLIWLLSGLKKAGIARPEVNPSPQAISILIPFRNEALRINPLLKSLAKLNLQKGDELILLDDGSTDVGIPADYPLRDEIKLVRIPAHQVGKKAALNHGFELSKNDWILTTDADCWFGDDWLNAWRTKIQPETNLLIGPVMSSGSGFLAQFDQAENACLLTITNASAGHNQPMLCSGANLLIRKSAWEAVGGYSAHANLASGDDVLLMKAIHTLNPKSIKAFADESLSVFTHAASSWQMWFVQRRRWASKSSHLSTNFQRIHGLMLLCWLVLFPIGLWYIGPAYGFMLLPEMYLIYEVSRSAGKPFNWYFWPVFRLFYPVLLVLMPITSFVWPSEWKSRSFQSE